MASMEINVDVHLDPIWPEIKKLGSENKKFCDEFVKLVAEKRAFVFQAHGFAKYAVHLSDEAIELFYKTKGVKV